MNYLSVCSGIEAATVAWHPLGWNPVGFAEIDKFPSAVLKHHYPEVPNYGDFTTIQDPGSIDLLVGGTPCQSFSVAGLRKGMADPRGNLALGFLGLADRTRPDWLVWENVLGVLSSNGGRDFGAFLGALGQLGYGWAYRVLDARWFGLPQSRSRVIVVGHSSGKWQRPFSVLHERKSFVGLTQTNATKRAGARRGLLEGRNRVSGCIDASYGSKWASNQWFLAGHTVWRGGRPSRLTPLEVERCFGFPDNYTRIPYRNKPAEVCPDGPRYKALGNSMAVPKMRWIGQRIQVAQQQGEK